MRVERILVVLILVVLAATAVIFGIKMIKIFKFP